MAQVIKGSSEKRRGKTTEALSTEKRKREEEDLDLNLSKLRGPNSVQCSTGAGELVRIYSPVSYLDWERIPNTLNEDVWNV
ncbi:hypothetical protein C5167_051200 [Papaver somniferum]|uniref:Uncharacterized protein n=1 Tax=Papaver somniferum TaxID=3469 RepID=A0A4Y7KS88_PAPSO|nr:hypothetical protein C5167_051200 [Papaver somniferum]